jgi:hypothetical protein
MGASSRFYQSARRSSAAKLPPRGRRLNPAGQGGRPDGPRRGWDAIEPAGPVRRLSFKEFVMHPFVDAYLKASLAMFILPMTVAAVLAGPYSRRPEDWPIRLRR